MATFTESIAIEQCGYSASHPRLSEDLSNPTIKTQSKMAWLPVHVTLLHFFLLPCTNLWYMYCIPWSPRKRYGRDNVVLSDIVRPMSSTLEEGEQWAVMMVDIHACMHACFETIGIVGLYLWRLYSSSCVSVGIIQCGWTKAIIAAWERHHSVMQWQLHSWYSKSWCIVSAWHCVCWM